MFGAVSLQVLHRPAQATAAPYRWLRIPHLKYAEYKSCFRTIGREGERTSDRKIEKQTDKQEETQRDREKRYRECEFEAFEA